jgi:hypothetical protein
MGQTAGPALNAFIDLYQDLTGKASGFAGKLF